MTSESFYTVMSSVSFTLLGLWWVVVQSREPRRLDPARRAMAWAVSLHFALPGAMSVLALVAPTSPGCDGRRSLLPACLASSVSATSSGPCATSTTARPSCERSSTLRSPSTSS